MQTNLAISLIFVLCLFSVKSQLTTTDPTFTYPNSQCPAAVAKTPANSRFTPSTTAPVTTGVPEINGISYTRKGSTDADNEAVEIRYELTGSIGSWSLIFTITKSTGVPVTRTVSLADATAPVFLAAQKNVFVFMTSTTRTAYLIDITTTVDIPSNIGTNIFSLDAPTTAYPGATQINDFKLSSIYVPITGDTIITCFMEGLTGTGYSDFINYAITPGTNTVTNSKAVASYATSPHRLAAGVLGANLDGVGFPQFYFDRRVTSGTDSGIVSYIGSSYVKVPSTVITIPNPTTISIVTVKLTSFQVNTNSHCALVFREGLNLVIVDSTFPRTSSLTLGDTFSYTALSGIWKVHTDNLQNLLVVSINRIIWYYTGRSSGATMIAVNSKSTAYTGNDLNIYTTDKVTFSGGLAFALTSSQITVYKIINPSRIDLYTALTLVADILAATVSSQLQTTITCQCSAMAVKRFTCFSSTLSCTTTLNTNWSTCA